jgi:hypothetical protein
VLGHLRRVAKIRPKSCSFLSIWVDLNRVPFYPFGLRSRQFFDHFSGLVRLGLNLPEQADLFVLFIYTQ